MEKDDDSKEDEIDCRSPYIQGFGSTIDDPSFFKVVLESNKEVSTPSLTTAIQYCFASYYINRSTMVCYVCVAVIEYSGSTHGITKVLR